MRVSRFRAGDRRFLVVDAEQYVPDRTAFAARHCDGADGVAPPEAGRATVDGGTVDVDDPERGADGGLATRASETSSARGADGVPASEASGGSSARAERGADGVLFLALESEFTPPRVVMTVVRPDGERTPCSVPGARCAARWVAARTGADRVMVDTQAGTREARVHGDGSVSVELEGVDECEAPDDVETERGPVVREFATGVGRPTP